jgi:hypothetical protein
MASAPDLSVRSGAGTLHGIHPESDVPPGLFLGRSVGNDRHDTPVSRHRELGSCLLGRQRLSGIHAGLQGAKSRAPD